MQTYALTVHTDYVYIYGLLAKTEANKDADFQSLQSEGTHAWIDPVLSYVCGELCMTALWRSVSMLTSAMQKRFSMFYKVADMPFSETVIASCIITGVQT